MATPAGSTSVDGFADSTVIRKNFIGGASSNGIRILESSSTLVIGNVIGLGVDIQTDVGNGGNGILIGSGAADTEIGSTIGDSENFIYNSGIQRRFSGTFRSLAKDLSHRNA